MFFVYYLLAVGSEDLLYIGRSHQPEARRQAFERKHNIQVFMGIPQRFSCFEEACSEELKAIASCWPPFNRYLTSSRGGRGLPKVHTDQTKQKISNTKKGVPNMKLRGRVFTAEAIAKMRVAKLGRKLSQETRSRMSQSRTGVKRPQRGALL